MSYFKIRCSGNDISFTPRIGEFTKDPALEVRFHRTLRVPDLKGSAYPLPPSCGYFPVRKVSDYENRVPQKWREQGGVFLPMFQREALWVSFQSPSWRPVAVKVAAGKVNAVSGKPWTEKLQADSENQDYLVTPPQPWLDGFKTGDGMVRQFVAMPLGMGYTVEGQVTGEETHGGLQLLVVDAVEGRFKPPVRRGIGAGGMSVNCNYEPMLFSSAAVATNSEFCSMGLAGGGSIEQKIYPDPYGIETWSEVRTGRVFVHIVNSSMWKEITGEDCPSSPVDAQTYARAGLPWFSLYDEGFKDVPAGNELASVKSVAQKDQEHGFVNQMSNEPVDASNVKKQAVPAIPPEEKDVVHDGNW